MPRGEGVAKTSRGGRQKFETWHLNTVPSELLLGGSGELKTAPEALHAHFAYSRNNNQIWHIFANSVVLTILKPNYFSEEFIIQNFKSNNNHSGKAMHRLHSPPQKKNPQLPSPPYDFVI